ncbi:MAG: hypothetical protein VW417_01960 [Alphaproteobacteria bacterium]
MAMPVCCAAKRPAALLFPVTSFILSFLLITQPVYANGHQGDSTQMSDFARAVQAVKDKDYQQALNLFEREAEKIEFEAMYNLAVLLKAGKGRPQNYIDSLYWAYLAQLGGIERAQDIIDDLTDILDETQRAPILKRVEKQLLGRINTGDFEAIPQYAVYFTTLLEEPDYAKAYQWYAIAAALGLSDMIELRDEMESELEIKDIPAFQAKSGELFTMLMNGQAIMIEEKAVEN